MKKKFLLISIFLLSMSTYSKTVINFSKQLVVIYKVLSPLKVTVEPTEKMVVKSGTQSFKYSETVASKQYIGIKIEAPYNERDEILDRIYGTATIELVNGGKFSLRDSSGEEIQGRGYFPSQGENSFKQVLPLYNTSFANKYEARTEVDAIFNEEQKMMKLGTYKGVLTVNVTYGD